LTKKEKKGEASQVIIDDLLTAILALVLIIAVAYDVLKGD